MTAQSWVFAALGVLAILLVLLCWVVDFQHKENRTPRNFVTAGAVSTLMGIYAGLAFGIAFQ